MSDEAAATTIDNVVREVVEHLAETSAAYRATVAGWLNLKEIDDDVALERIGEVLQDADEEVVLDVANECLSDRFERDGDGVLRRLPKADAGMAP